MLRTVCLVVCLVGAHVGTSQKLGERCVVEHSGRYGVCEDAEVCRSVHEDLEENHFPTFCTFSYDAVVVCCTDYSSVINALLPSQKPVSNQTINNGNLNLRVSERKCEEYSRLVTNSFRFVPLISGGEAAQPGDFPHMAAIGWQYKVSDKIDFKCAGSLISPRFVMSTATCTYDQGKLLPRIVRLGTNSLDDDEPSAVDIEIKRFVPHPEFKSPRKYNDIALFELSRAAEPGPTVRPACLWTRPDLAGHAAAVATGWGRTDFHANEGSNILLKVKLNLMSNDECHRLLKNNYNRNFKALSESQICAGDSAGGKGTCQGDGGAPLQVSSPDSGCVFYIVGITSFGVGCARADKPDVFTRVSAYIEWIESTVWPGE